MHAVTGTAVTGTGRIVGGRYELLDAMGHGATGTVWRARDPVLAREVAVKEVSLPGVTTEQERKVLHERTLREARAAAKLNHPAVVTVYDVIEADGSPWIIMELVSARSLEQVIAQDGPLSPGRAAEMGVMLLGALASAHSAGIVHRDVKPANVLLTPDGRAVLTDFGIATVDGEPGLTQVGIIMGTPGFCAPERIRGEPASPASDLWSLGATLYAAVEGRGPFHRQGSPMAVLADIVHSEPPSPSLAGPLGPVITSLLSRNPAQRPDAASASRELATVTPSGLTAACTVPSSASVTPAPAAPVQPATTTEDWPAPAESPGPTPPGPGLVRPATLTLPSIIPPASVVPPTQSGAVSPSPSPSPQTARRMRMRDAGHAAPGVRRHRQPRARPMRLSRRRRALATGSVAVVGATILAVALIAGTGPSATAGRATATRPARRARAPLPPGFHWYSGSDASAVMTRGFSVGVPDGWQASQRGTATSLRDPATGGSITITPLRSGSADPLQEVQALARAAVRHGRPRGYHRIAVGLFAFRGVLGGMWRFSYRSQAGTVDALDVVARLGAKEYELSVAAPAAHWRATRAVFAKVIRTFTPHRT